MASQMMNRVRCAREAQRTEFRALFADNVNRMLKGPVTLAQLGLGALVSAVIPRPWYRIL